VNFLKGDLVGSTYTSLQIPLCRKNGSWPRRLVKSLPQALSDVRVWTLRALTSVNEVAR
jgi:hypothetical protein